MPLCAATKPRPARVAHQQGADMTGPSWLAGTFVAVVILAGAYSAGRLAISLRRGRAAEFDADALHAVMGAAMAGMLVPRLSVLPDGVWVVIFGIAAAWFGWRAMRARGFTAVPGSPFRLPVPHLIECAAMLYMLLPGHGPRPTPGRGGMAMAGMGASAGPGSGFPVLAVILVLFMLGYIVWTTDRLASLARARIAAAGPGRGRRSPAAPPVAPPGLATCGKLAMNIAMGYMLFLMI